jgi:hypothetical protein
MRYTTLFYVMLLDDVNGHYIHLIKNASNETSNSVEKSLLRRLLLPQTLKFSANHVNRRYSTLFITPTPATLI